LSKELPLYRQAPERYIDALCSHVAAVVLGDGARSGDVREEVERELERREA
jgi:hypothetical protein